MLCHGFTWQVFGSRHGAICNFQLATFDADQSSDRRRKLIFECSMEQDDPFIDGTGHESCFTCPRHHMVLHHVQKFFGTWHGMLPPCVRMDGFDVCSPGMGRPRHTWESLLPAYHRRVDLGSFWMTCCTRENLGPYHGLVHWEVTARIYLLWKQQFSTVFKSWLPVTMQRA